MAIYINGWNLEVVPRWYTTDDRFFFDKRDGGWQIITTLFSDELQLEEFFGDEFPQLTLKQCVEICHQLTGCHQKVYRKCSIYIIVSIPLALEKSTESGWVFATYMYMWDKLDAGKRNYWQDIIHQVNQSPMSVSGWPTRGAALDVLTHVCQQQPMPTS